MPSNRKYLFYKSGQLSSEMSSGLDVTLLSADDIPLAERSAKTMLMASNAQRSIVNANRNNCKDIIYTAYGHSQMHCILGFTGQRYDRFTKCYLLGNGYRAFSPCIMRFFSADSLSPFGSRTLNAYAYCMGDPINRDDASGHMWRATKTRTKKMYTAAKARFKKPDYRDEANAALASSPELNAKYGHVIGAPGVTRKHYKAIALIPKIETSLEEHKQTAFRNLRLWKREDALPLDSENIDMEKYLDFEDFLNYSGLTLDLHKYEERLKHFTPSSSTSQAAIDQIRKGWETFES
ncbi:RHS repeat-associated core domain-containing protein [Pseudomonas shirazica]|uniref:RHS repeat-associated core domain-containing protein n=1 Tax=Pseudomonas shirazica TaxID=1940636 RepID=UPI001EDE2AD3|nr:RHS repeat-associated core domain-containing protein [Pseudomonas shirazica]